MQNTSESQLSGHNPTAWTENQVLDLNNYLDEKFVEEVKAELAVAITSGAKIVGVPVADMERLVTLIDSRNAAHDAEVENIEDEIEKVKIELAEANDELAEIQKKLEDVKKDLEGIPESTEKAAELLDDYAELLENLHVMGLKKESTDLDTLAEIALDLRGIGEAIAELDLDTKSESS